MSRIEPELPAGYHDTVADLTHRVHAARVHTQRAVNTALIELYWDIGRTILDRQQAEPWGNKVLERLARDLRSAFPRMKGFNRRNLYYLRAFAQAWDDSTAIAQTPSAQLSWATTSPC